MCIQEFCLFTFSNWTAFVEARLRTEERYGEQVIRGYFCFITGYVDEETKKKRDDLSFDELNELGHKCQMTVNELPFSTWEEYYRNIKFLEGKNLKDVFGAIQVSIQ